MSSFYICQSVTILPFQKLSFNSIIIMAKKCNSNERGKHTMRRINVILEYGRNGWQSLLETVQEILSKSWKIILMTLVWAIKPKAIRLDCSLLEKVRKCREYFLNLLFSLKKIYFLVTWHVYSYFPWPGIKPMPPALETKSLNH